MQNNHEIYYNHYIRIDDNKRIICTLSDALETPKSGDILINDKGGYQF